MHSVARSTMIAAALMAGAAVPTSEPVRHRGNELNPSIVRRKRKTPGKGYLTKRGDEAMRKAQEKRARKNAKRAKNFGYV